MGIDDSGADKSESRGGSGGKACDAGAEVLGHSGFARSHYQGSGDSYQSLLIPQWQTEDLEGTVANRLWRWYAHRPEDPEDNIWLRTGCGDGMPKDHIYYG